MTPARGRGKTAIRAKPWRDAAARIGADILADALHDRRVFTPSSGNTGWTPGCHPSRRWASRRAATSGSNTACWPWPTSRPTTGRCRATVPGQPDGPPGAQATVTIRPVGWDPRWR